MIAESLRFQHPMVHISVISFSLRTPALGRDVSTRQQATQEIAVAAQFEHHPLGQAYIHAVLTFAERCATETDRPLSDGEGFHHAGTG